MRLNSPEEKNLKVPTTKDIRLAGESIEKLLPYISSTNETGIQFIRKGKNTETIMLPRVALDLLMSILYQMSKGNAITIIPVHQELTTQEAADLLNVSRPYLVKLLEERQIPSRKVGNRRLVRAEDIVRYKNDIDMKREEILDELANEAQKHDMGY